MQGDINVHDVKVLESLSSAVDHFEGVCNSVVSEKSQLLSATIQALKDKINEIETRIASWNREYMYWSQRIYSTDEKGNRVINHTALQKASEAQTKMKKCEAMKQGAQMHMNIMIDKSRVNILSGIRSNATQSCCYLQELKNNIVAYDNTNLDAISYFCTSYRGMTLERSQHSLQTQQCTTSKYRKTIQFEGRTVLQREIDWNAVYKGKTNLERALDGGAPYSPDGKRIELHHIGQDYNGSLAEVPQHLHHSKQYNLHRMYPGKISFRKDATLGRSFDAFRERYWTNRAHEYRNGG